MPLAIEMLLGCLFVNSTTFSAYIFLVIAIIYAVGMLFYEINNKLRIVYIILSLLCALVFFVTGAIRYNVYLGDRNYIDRIEEGDTITFQGRLAKKEKKTTSYYLYFNNIITNDQVFDSNETIILQSDSDELPIDSTVIVTGKKVQFNIARNEGNFDEKSYYNSIGALCKIEGNVDRVCEESIGFGESLYRLKEDMKEVFSSNLPGEEGGIISAMTLGDKSDLDSEAKDLFKLSGLAHILAISGLHISIVGMCIYRLMRRRGVPFVVAGIVSSFLVILYGLLVNGGVSTVRAIVMFLCVIMANILGESYDSLTAIGVALIFVLILYPYCIESAGFVFSFGAVTGITVIVNPCVSIYDKFCRMRFMAHHIRGKYKPSIKERLCKAILGGILIQLVTLPIVCWYYYEIPLYVVFLNIIVIPLLSVLLSSALIGGILGVFSLFTLGIVIIGNVISFFSSVLLYVSHIIIYLYEMLAYYSLNLPFSRIVTGKPSIVKVIIYYVVFFIVVRYFLYKTRDIEECSAREFKIHRIRMLLCSVALFVITVLITNNNNRLDYELDMVDVGQGDGIYISANGSNYFIDGGSSNVKNVGTYRILPFLKHKGIRGIDYWFVSHTDSDHISGLLEALDSGYKIDNIVVDRYMLDEENYKLIMEKAISNDTELLVMNKGDVVGDSVLYFTCIFAGSDGIDDINANSLVLLGEYRSGDNSITMLLGGDMTAESEKCILEDKSYNIANIDILKVAHHGSKTSSSKEFVDALSPDIALISAGVNNRYGHPHKLTLDTLEDASCDIYRTDLGGRVMVDMESNKVLPLLFGK